MSFELTITDSLFFHSLIAKEKKYRCMGLCSKCVYLELGGTVKDCNPSTFKEKINKCIEESINVEGIG